MKKFLIALCSLALLLVSCRNLNNNKKSEEVGQLKITLGAPRMIKPDYKWYADGVKKWDITFTPVDGTAAITKKDVTLESGDVNQTGAFTLPVKTYNIEITGVGRGTDGTDNYNYTLYGHTENVEIKADETTAVVIFVDLKKTSGTDASYGTFEYKFNVAKYAFTTSSDPVKISINDEATALTACLNDESNVLNVISAYLTSAAGSNRIDLKIACDVEELSADSDSVVEITFSGEKVPSGYYYLIIKYNTDDNSVYSISPDNIVEIADGLSTTDYLDAIYTFDTTKEKDIYVTNDTDDNANVNGVIDTNPKGLNAALKWFTENDYSWNYVVLDYVSEDSDVHPQISVDYIPTKEGDGKTVKLYLDEHGRSITFTNGKAYLENSEYGVLDFISSAETPAAFELYTTSTEETPIAFNGLVKLENVTLTINDVYANGSGLTVTPAEYAEYTEDSTPFLTINYKDDKRYNVILSETSGDVEYSYFTKTTESTDAASIAYYVSVAGYNNNTISKSVPDFTISGSDEISLDGSSTASYTCMNGETALGTDFSYKWFLNGKLLSQTIADDPDTEEDETCTAEAFTLNPLTNSYVKVGKNNLMVEVTGSDGYTVSKSLVVTISKEKISAIYHGSYLYAGKLNNLSTVNTLTKVSTSYTDFATDNDENLYVAEAGKIIRYKNIDEDSEEVYPPASLESPVTTDIKLYYDTSDDALYFGTLGTSTFQVYKYLNVSKIKDFTTAAPEEVFNFSTAITVAGFSYALQSFDDFVVYNSTLYFISLSDAYDWPFLWTAKDNTVDGDNRIDLCISDMNTDKFAITDITVVNETIYTLVAERNTDCSGGFYSRGAVIPVDPSTNQIKTDSYYLDLYYGYYGDNTAINVYDDEDDENKKYNFENYADFAYSYFFGPAKFLAVTPKKLYIADDGAYFDYDSENSSHSIENVNRIVTFNLEKNTIAGELTVDSYLGYEADFTSGGSFEDIYFSKVTNPTVR